ncbi:MAG: amino acid transporter [Porticoccus sp.]|jgi:amino acid transporter
MIDQPATLNRTLSFWQLTFYGVGTILGAGIYVLIGEVAVVAGMWTPLSFIMAALLAALTGLSFAELSSRFPLSAGEAVYVKQGFNNKWLSVTVGLAVVLTGIVSSATLVNGFVGYFRELANLPDIIVICVVCILLGVVAAWGIAESVKVAIVITIAEVLGLIAVVIVSLPAVMNRDVMSLAPQAMSDSSLWLGLLSGAGIAFYAFIGFEDMVNVAEEVKDVRRVMPRAIILTLVITSILYFVVAFVVIQAIPLAELKASEAPLAKVFYQATGSSNMISIIALFAVINGALIQVVMAARVLYGGGRQGWLPQVFAKVHKKTQTPLLATGLVTLLVLVFALWLPLGTLARLTSFIILVIFTVVNAALVRIKTRNNDSQADSRFYYVPIWVPIAGTISSALFVAINSVALLQN